MKNWVDEHFYDLLADSSTLNNFEFTLMQFILLDESPWIRDFIKHVQNTIAFKQNILNEENRRKSIWNKKVLYSLSPRNNLFDTTCGTFKILNETKNIFTFPVNQVSFSLIII